jgi:hypothetical protein
LNQLWGRHDHAGGRSSRPFNWCPLHDVNTVFGGASLGWVIMASCNSGLKRRPSG